MAVQRPPVAPPPQLEDEDFPEPPRIRALRRLVTLLTLSAIIGVLVVAATLVIRLGQPLTPRFDVRAVSAETVAVPPEEAVVAAGAADGALILITRDAGGAERLRLYDATDGALVRTVEITRTP